MADNLEGPDQRAPFQIERPDEDGCVWISSAPGRESWRQNLGPFQPTADRMADGLEQNDYLE